MRNKNELFDLRALGLAIKEARIKQGMTREEAAALIPIDPRYLTNIENKGQHPSLQVFYELITLFNISVDQFFYSSAKPEISSRRRQLDEKLNMLDDKNLIILEATVNGIMQSQEITTTKPT